MSDANVDFIDLDEISETTAHLAKIQLSSTIAARRSLGISRSLDYTRELEARSWTPYATLPLSTTSRLANKVSQEIVEAVLQKTRERLGHGFFALAAPGYLYAAVQREAVQGGVSMLDDKKVQEIMGRHLDAAGAFWGALEFEPQVTPTGARPLFFARFVES